MEKQQLVNFIAKVMEESGFKVYKDFKTSQKIVDIYGVLATTMGDFGVVVACKNYDKQWEVGIDVLKEMELVGRNLKASKIVVVSSSNFSSQAKNYGARKNIKLVDRDNLMILAKKYSKKENERKNSDSNYNNADLASNSPNNTEDLSTFDNEYDSKYYTGYDDYGQDYYPHRPNDIYRDGSTYISGKSSARLGKFGSRSNTESRANRRSSLFNKKLKESASLSVHLKPILNNTIILIILVVAISYLISSLIGVVSGASRGLSGLVKILSSLILSYGLVLSLNRDGTTVLVKGTTVFFISLVILIMIIILV